MDPTRRWIVDLPGTTPQREALTVILKDRFRPVARLVAHPRRAAHDDRAVHELRVAVRRADAAAILFGPALGERRRRRLRRSLRRLLHAAGRVRACDVNAAMLTAWRAGRPDAAGALDTILRELRRERGHAAKRLRRAMRRNDPGHLRRRRRAAVRACPRGGRLQDLAHAALGRALGRVRRAIDEEASLHALRLSVKRLRYILEVAAPVLGRRAATDAVGALSVVQDRLGALHDAAEAIRVVAGALEARGDPPGPGWSELRELLVEQRAAFQRAAARRAEWRTPILALLTQVESALHAPSTARGGSRAEPLTIPVPPHQPSPGSVRGLEGIGPPAPAGEHPDAENDGGSPNMLHRCRRGRRKRSGPASHGASPVEPGGWPRLGGT